MTQNSYPKVNAPFTDDQWQNLFVTLGRGIIDKGGFPYKLTNQDSVNNTVTIGVAATDPAENVAVLDGFLHHMDAPEPISVPPVTVDTTYEIGLEYDPLGHEAQGGPLTLKAWVAPADTSTGKSHLVLYRMTRRPNLALGSTPYTEERPRAVPVFSVSREDQLPQNSLVLVDSLGIVRTSNSLHRADIDAEGNITWSALGGSSSDGGLTDAQLQDMKDKLDAATWATTGNTLMWRGSDGVSRVESNTSHPGNIVNLQLGDARYAYKAHTHSGDDITSRVPFEHVDGSLAAYQNTNVGSTWASVVATSAGFLGRYPSALKYKQNIRPWNLDADTAYGVTPVKYEDKQNGDTRVGFVADSYVNTLPELVETNPETGEVEGWKYMLTCVLQQVAIRDLNDRVKALEDKLGGTA